MLNLSIFGERAIAELLGVTKSLPQHVATLIGKHVAKATLRYFSSKMHYTGENGLCSLVLNTCKHSEHSDFSELENVRVCCVHLHVHVNVN